MKIHRLCNHRAVHVYTEPRSCVKVEVAVLGSPSLIVLMVSVELKQHFKKFNGQSSGAV